MTNKNSEAHHTAQRQIETKIRIKIRRGELHISSADIESDIKKLALKTYGEASKQSKECVDPAQKGESFKRAGVACEIVQQILHNSR